MLQVATTSSSTATRARRQDNPPREQADLELLRLYPWPGNVRDLQNVIERSVLLCESLSAHEEASIEDALRATADDLRLEFPQNKGIDRYDRPINLRSSEWSNRCWRSTACKRRSMLRLRI